MAETFDLIIKGGTVSTPGGLGFADVAITRRAAFHSKDEYRLAERRKLARQGDWTSHSEVRDAEAAISSTRRLVSLARKTGKRIQVLHVTTG